MFERRAMKKVAKYIVAAVVGFFAGTEGPDVAAQIDPELQNQLVGLITAVLMFAAYWIRSPKDENASKGDRF